MALMEWDNKYSVGIESIDVQHKKIIEYINQLHDGMTSGKGAALIGPILKNLVEYTQKHFKYEEELFAKHGYAEASAHKAEHDKLVAQVADFQTKYNSGLVGMSMDIMKFLKGWLSDHINGSDKKYSAHLKSKGVK